MVDISFTSDDVVVANSAEVQTVILGAAVQAGDVIVYDPGNENWIEASNTSSLLSGGGVNSYILIALADGASGQRIAAAKAGYDVTFGGGLVAGRVYILSAAGAISPESDAASNDFMTIIGYAKSTTVMFFNPTSTNVQIV